MPSTTLKSVFFIPVWNQIEEFPNVLKELKAQPLPCDTILLVNNGSDDGSEKLVRESGYPYIDIPKNLGVGYSYLKAVEWAIEHGYDILGTMAANGKMLPSQMPRLLAPIIEEDADYVTGSRFLPSGDSPNLPLFRRGSIPIVNLFIWLLFGVRLTDATCGYRAMKVTIFRDIVPNWDNPWLYTYGFEYYVYAHVIKNKLARWKEVPITMRYPSKGKRYSKIKPFKGWYQMLKPWVVVRFSQIKKQSAS